MFFLLTLVMLNIYIYKFTYQMTNSADPDQLASSEAIRSGSTLLDKAGYIRVHQDKG